MHPTAPSLQNPYLSKASLAAALEISESTVDDFVRRKILPPPVRLSPGCVRWDWEEVRARLDSLKPGDNAAASDPAMEGVRHALEAEKERRRGRSA